jgi:hypothetical protein
LEKDDSVAGMWGWIAEKSAIVEMAIRRLNNEEIKRDYSHEFKEYITHAKKARLMELFLFVAAE